MIQLQVNGVRRRPRDAAALVPPRYSRAHANQVRMRHGADVPFNPRARLTIGSKPQLPLTGAKHGPARLWAICITPPLHQVLYSSDGYPGGIYKLSLDGKVLGAFGESGRQFKRFGWIHDIAGPSENVLFVAELLNWRVQKLILEPAPKGPGGQSRVQGRSLSGRVV